MKKFILSAGFMLAAAVTFAGTPKGETKDANSSASAKSEAGVSMKWYAVTYDAAHPNGYIPAGASPLVTGERSQAEDLHRCDDGSNYDCLRGFTSTPSLPTNNSGNDQITTNDIP